MAQIKNIPVTKDKYWIGSSMCWDYWLMSSKQNLDCHEQNDKSLIKTFRMFGHRSEIALAHTIHPIIREHYSVHTITRPHCSIPIYYNLHTCPHYSVHPIIRPHYFSISTLLSNLSTRPHYSVISALVQTTLYMPPLVHTTL